MKSAKVRLSIILVCILLLDATFVADLLGRMVPLELVAKTVGIPLISNSNCEYRCTDITQVVEGGNHLYVLSGHKSIVQVYTLEGTYVHTISVYNYHNGRTELALKEDVLYISDKHHNLYLFSGGQFLEYVDGSESEQISRSLPFGVSDASYFIKNGSVWKDTGENGNVCIVEVPPVFGFYENATSWKIKLALLLIIGFTLYLFPTKRKAKP
jgi:hypothetical protein